MPVPIPPKGEEKIAEASEANSSRNARRGVRMDLPFHMPRQEGSPPTQQGKRKISRGVHSSARGKRKKIELSQGFGIMSDGKFMHVKLEDWMTIGDLRAAIGCSLSELNNSGLFVSK